MVSVLELSNTCVHCNAQFSGSVSLTPKILKFVPERVNKLVSEAIEWRDGQTLTFQAGGSYKFNSLTQFYAICFSLVE